MHAHRRNAIAFTTWVRMMCVRGVAVAVVLATTASAAAQGFNVNTDMTFTPLVSTYQSITSATGCPPGFSGQFTFTAALTTLPGGPALPHLTVHVVTLTNGNLLLDPHTNEVLGGEGAEMTVPEVGQYADGLLSPGESVNVPFAVCLKTFQPFELFVDVFGVVTQLVSINRFGTGSGISGVSTGFPSISADGRFVAFHSDASDLTANDTNGNTQDVFVRDLQMGTTTLVSVNGLGTGSGNNGSSGSNGLPGTSLGHAPAISADGRFVAFVSTADDLTANDSNGNIQDVFVRDLQMRTTTLVSVNQSGTGSGNDSSETPVISPDGRFVAFVSTASDLTAHDDGNGAGGRRDVYVRNLQMGTTTLVSINRGGTASADDFSQYPAMSADGRFVAFMSQASDLTANADGGPNVFVRDLQMETTTLASVNRFGTDANHRTRVPPQISANGRFVAFTSEASDLTANDTNGNTFDVFVRDLQTGTTTLVSANRFGTGSGNGSSRGEQISANGRFVAFDSDASDLTANDTNGTSDVFVRDLQSGTTTLVSVNRLGTGSAGAASNLPVISADGRFVAFISGAQDLTADDTNGRGNVFVRDLEMGTTTLLSINWLGTGGGNGNSDTGQVISADGRFVAFRSFATDLVTTTDINGSEADIFVRPVAP
jgi:hypothetical protein